MFDSSAIGKVLIVVLIGVAMPRFAFGADGDDPADAGVVPAVAQYTSKRLLSIGGVTQLTINGEPTLELQLSFVDDPEGGSVKYYVPNLPDRDGRAVLKPLPAVVDPIRALGIGGVVQATLGVGRQGVTVIALTPVKHQPGEETASGYVVRGIEKIAGDDPQRTLVHCTKFGKPHVFIVPVRLEAGRKQVNDSEILAALDSVAPGDVVEIEAGAQTAADGPRPIEFISLWRPTAVGAVVKHINKDGRRWIEIKIGGQTERFLIHETPETRRVDRALLEKLMPGHRVRFSTVDGPNPLLRTIVLEGSIQKSERNEYILRCGQASAEIRMMGGRSSMLMVSERRKWEEEEAEIGPSLARYGANRLLLEPEQIKQLKELPIARLGLNDSVIGTALSRHVAATTDAARRATEQELLLIYQDYLLKSAELAAEQTKAARKILTPEQMEVMSQAKNSGGGMIITR